ncbi:19294_t:CDS:2 [Rhizophagus irregularis]|nr:19294_t:CDS:2 [Rhizophagus irregularis]
MRLCDAPPELLEMIKRSEMKNEKSLPEKSITSNTVVKTVSTSTITNNSSFHKIITSDEKRHRFRKNPYPKKAPSKSSPGITLQVDVYTTLKEDPKALLRRSDSSTTSSISSSSSFLSSFNDSSSGTESSPPQSPQRNSLARVMADRGLLESTLTPIVVAGEIKPIRIPPPPPMQFDELMKNIEQLNLDLTVLQRINPKISWKGQPLSILHLPHYNSLHSKEAHVASTLRLTPVQYLTAKHTLISSARRYVQKSLPFRKSDAQKLLRIDVNKASKLWEFFMQVKWI